LQRASRWLCSAVLSVGQAWWTFRLTATLRTLEFEDKPLSKHLADLRSANGTAAQRTAARQKFRAFAAFMRSVVDGDLEIDIPAGEETLRVVRSDVRDFDLKHVGRGISEAVVIGAVATGQDNSIICIDEPELHLHPSTQRKLIDYLTKETTNQYVVATHSASFLDAKSLSVHSISHDGETSQIEAVLTDGDRWELCSSLGYRPSDIVQSNYVVWVEGPSDRIYLNYRISQIAPELRENIHYSVIYYGGAVLADYASEVEVPGADIVALKAMNRSMTVLMDSHRSEEEGKLTAAKLIVIASLDGDDHGFAWVTAGRAIEQYVPFETLSTAVATVHPRLSHVSSGEKFEPALLMKNGDSKSNPNKPGIAREVVRLNPPLDQFDLREKCERLVGLIRRANHLPTTSGTA